MTPFEFEEREARILASFREGHNNPRIAETFNVTERTVTRWRNRYNMKLRPSEVSQPHPPSDRRRAEELLDEGCSFYETARTIGVAARTIYRWFPDREPWTHAQVVEHAVISRTMGRLVA